MSDRTLELVSSGALMFISALVCFACLGIVVAYSRRRPVHGGLKRWHVLCVALGTAGTSMVLVLAQLDSAHILTAPRWIRLVSAFGSQTLLLVSLVLIGLVVRARMREQRAPRTATPSTGPDLPSGPC